MFLLSFSYGKADSVIDVMICTSHVFIENENIEIDCSGTKKTITGMYGTGWILKNVISNLFATEVNKIPAYAIIFERKMS